jgi:hypothetical protein
MSYFSTHNGPGGGNFWYGAHGFMYKKKQGGGGKKNPAYGLICNRPTVIWNKYTPGAGVGGTSVAVRRSKNRLATSCNKTQTCGRFYTTLGIKMHG